MVSDPSMRTSACISFGGWVSRMAVRIFERADIVPALAS